MTATGAPIAEGYTASARQTQRVAAALALVCRPGDVVLLVGGLGAGKTTFAQGFAHGLGVDQRVISPTFTLVRQYRTDRAHGGIRQLLHADVHRLDDLAEMEDLALHELVEEAAVALVEWGERAAPVLGASALSVELSPRGARSAAAGASGEEGRRLALWATGPAWADRLEQLARVVRTTTEPPPPAEATGDGR